MRSPTVSVIIPVYNTAQYIERCLQSVIIQTFTDYEIVVIDDGSTDNSWQILQKYSHNKRIKLLQKQNGGLSDARNFGLQNASGNYFAFVDSDDWIQKDFLATMIHLAKKHHAEMVICNLQKVNEKEQVFKKLPQLSHLSEKIVLQDDFSIFGEASSFACNKLFKRELFDDEKFPLKLHFEDIATIPRLMLKCTIIAKTNCYLYNYFERQGSITQSFTEKGLDMFTAIKIVKNAFENSPFFHQNKEWKRFLIYQGYYSFLAYFARTKDIDLRKKMYEKLETLLYEERINKKEIILYKRLNVNYLASLNFKKIIFYLLMLTFPKFVIKL